eukprot:1139225-Pelagomonas_calceolata.AAC.1
MFLAKHSQSTFGWWSSGMGEEQRSVEHPEGSRIQVVKSVNRVRMNVTILPRAAEPQMTFTLVQSISTITVIPLLCEGMSCLPKRINQSYTLPLPFSPLQLPASNHKWHTAPPSMEGLQRSWSLFRSRLTSQLHA